MQMPSALGHDTGPLTNTGRQMVGGPERRVANFPIDCYFSLFVDLDRYFLGHGNMGWHPVGFGRQCFMLALLLLPMYPML